MLSGLNTAVQYRGEIYHVQTEDGGRGSPVITTLLFKGGAVLLSRKTNYANPTEGERRHDLCGGGAEVVKASMKEQHRNMLKDLVAGKIPLPASAPEG